MEQKFTCMYNDLRADIQEVQEERSPEYFGKAACEVSVAIPALHDEGDQESNDSE